MSQLNIHMTEAFEKKLKRYMRARGIKTKSDALQQALDDAIKLTTKKPSKDSFKDLLGSANKFPQRPRRDWLSEDDLWEKNGH
jgi:hypothetical protein